MKLPIDPKTVEECRDQARSVADGVHEFIDQFIIDNNKLATTIQDQYLV